MFLIPLWSFGQDLKEIKFIWKSAESNSQKFEKAAMLIPIRFKADTTTYFLQFDTGATHSYLYSNRLPWFSSKEELMQTSIGEITFKDNKSIKPTAEKTAPIGTLGADWLKDKIVQINFVDQTVKFNHPYNTSDYFIKPLYTLNGRPVIEVTVYGNEEKLLYDTGSSLFGIWINKKNWKKLRDKSDQVKSFPISSWGKINKGYYSKLDKAIPPIWEGSSNDIDLQIWFVDNRNFTKFFRKNDIFGILGNQAFLNKEVVIDFQEGLFGSRTVNNNI